MVDRVLSTAAVWCTGAAVVMLSFPAFAVEPVETALVVAPEAPARLTLAYWPEAGWIVRQNGRQVELTFPGAQLEIGLGAIALPFGNGAIETLSGQRGADATYLRFGLGCDCTIATQGDGAKLAIDVVGADLAAGPIYDEPGPAPRLAPVPARRPLSVFDAGPAHAVDLEATRTRLLGELHRAAESGLVTLREEAESIPNDAPGAEVPPPLTSPPGDLATVPNPAGAAVVSSAAPSLAEAALPERPVRIVKTPPLDPTAVAHDKAQAVPEPVSTPDVAPEMAPDESPDAEMPAERDRHQALVSITPGDECIDNEAFQLPDLLPGSALVAKLSELRRVLMGEFDRPDPDVVGRLARRYIADGLGIEALGLLADLGTDVPDRDLLAALAWIVEDRALPNPNVLSVPGCPGQHALWRALNSALAGRSAEAVRDEEAATGALEQMARGMRGRAAARLGLAAADQGDPVATHRLFAMAKRAVAEGDRAGQELLLLLGAADARLRNADAIAHAALAKLRGSRSVPGAEALLAIAAAALDDGQMIPRGGLDHLRHDLGALALIQRGSKLGERAFLAEVRLTGLQFGRDAAFDLLEHGFADTTVGDAAYRATLASVHEMPSQPGDTPLAVTYEAAPDRFAGSLEDRAFRLALARSYTGLGVPMLAEGILRRGDLDGAGLAPDMGLAYLAIGDGAAARRIAHDLAEGPARSRIEGGVALAEGDHATALTALTAMNAPPLERARVAWSARDWDASVAALAEAALAIGPAMEAGAAAKAGPNTNPPAQMRHALRLAYAALRAGDDVLPAEARAMAAGDADMVGGLEAMFTPLTLDADSPEPAEISASLARLQAEARILEALLDDG